VLVGGLAHDFNNMLSVIIGCAEQIGEVPGLDSATRSDAENILVAAQRASQLTKELMVFSRREGNVPRPLTLQTVLSEFHGLLTAAVGRLVEVEIALPPDLPPMLADGGRLEHALFNLAVNARDAMPDGGTLTFTANHVRLTELDGVHPGTYIRLSVRDTGSGMTQEVARRVIEPFYSTKPVGKGTGLGLSSVHGIVTSAGGTMTIESQPGEGTTVNLYFPAAAEVHAATEHQVR
jgi:signal transduction histidine kinase